VLDLRCSYVAAIVFASSSIWVLTESFRPLDPQSGLTCFRLFQDAGKVALTCKISLNPGLAGGTTVENDPKSATSRRTLPLPDRLVSVLKAAKARQAAERLALGTGAFAYVVSSEEFPISMR
jgi:hypothetical protein